MSHALIYDRGMQLHLLANDNPKDAVGGAKQLVETVCRTVLRLIGEPDPGSDIVDIAKATLEALELGPAAIGDAKKEADLVRK